MVSCNHYRVDIVAESTQRTLIDYSRHILGHAHGTFHGGERGKSEVQVYITFPLQGVDGRQQGKLIMEVERVLAKGTFDKAQ